MIAHHCICCESSRLQRSPAVLMPFVAARAFGWHPVEIAPNWGLRDLRPGMAYPLCNSVLCDDCGVLFCDIRFADHEMAALYARYRGEEYTALRDSFEPGYRKRNELLAGGVDYVPQVEAFLSRFVTPVAVLDWGGDTGRNTPFATRAKVSVFDISETSTLAHANRVARAQIERGAYDLVVCSNVLEHVPDPAATIADIRDTMDPATFLYLEVPHEAMMRSRAEKLHVLKKHWHEHVNFFSERSLVKLFGRCRLNIVGMQEIEVTVGGKHGHQLCVACRVQ